MNENTTIIHARGVEERYNTGKLIVSALRGIDLDAPSNPPTWKPTFSAEAVFPRATFCFAVSICDNARSHFVIQRDHLRPARRLPARRPPHLPSFRDAANACVAVNASASSRNSLERGMKQK